MAKEYIESPLQSQQAGPEEQCVTNDNKHAKGCYSGLSLQAEVKTNVHFRLAL